MFDNFIIFAKFVSIILHVKSMIVDHHLFIREYVEILKNAHDKQKKNLVDLQSTKFVFIIDSFRKLIIAASFVFLKRFDRILKKIDLFFLIDDMNVLRIKNFNVYQFVDMIKRRNDSQTDFVYEKLKFFIFDSFALRYIYNEIHIYVLLSIVDMTSKKLLLCENVSLNAQFGKMTLNVIYVEIAVLHADLFNTNRIDFVNRFNDFIDFLIVLIIMHAVSAQKVNLNKACNGIMIVTNAINAPLKGQNGKRVLGILFNYFGRFGNLLIIQSSIAIQFCQYRQDRDFEQSGSMTKISTIKKIDVEFNIQDFFIDNKKISRKSFKRN